MKQTKITEFYKKNVASITRVTRGQHPVTKSWHCIECGEDMGINNPRQLCGTYKCFKSGFY